MKKFILSLAAAATLLIGSLATPSTAEARPWGWRGGYYGGYYRPYYGGGYYRPNYGAYYRPYNDGYYPGYRTYYRYGYGYPGYYNRGYGYPDYYSAPGVRIGAGIGGVRIY